jgi:hypothetical protein
MRRKCPSSYSSKPFNVHFEPRCLGLGKAVAGSCDPAPVTAANTNRMMGHIRRSDLVSSPSRLGWSLYGSIDAVTLALILIAGGGWLVLTGSRIRGEIGLKGPGKAGGLLIVLTWATSIVVLLVVLAVIVSPLTKISRHSVYSLAAMFGVFGVWALFGFSYPSDPIPFALNSTSKILSFNTALLLFWRPTGLRHDRGALSRVDFLTPP